MPADEASLVEEGILDSFGLAELIAMLESRYALKIPDRDLKLEIFESIAKIGRYVEAHAEG